MVFSSFQFLFYFLPAFLLLNFLLPGTRARNANILVFSLLFYAWGEAAYVLVLLASAGFNWALGLLIEGARGEAQRRRLIAVGVGGNLLALAWFKYAAFLANQVLGLALDQEAVSIHMPIGISFFTFQAISYLIDVYRREVPAQRSLLTFCAYKSLFPQLIAGPIVRYAQVDRQFAERRASLDDVTGGLQLFAIGLAQKVLLANPCGAVADKVFSAPLESVGSAAAWIGTYAYTLQIYFDFCGYSLMALGLGRVMGFTFPENFRLPYTALSITDFWRRWHISLSSWFRDYLYKPLGGNRAGQGRTLLNLLIVFVLCGLWHGASWMFVLWGLYHGLLLCLEKYFLGGALARLPGPLRWGYAFVAVMVGWVFFRSDSLDQAWQILGLMAGLGQPAADDFERISLYDLLPYESMLFMGLASFFAFGLWSALVSRLKAVPLLLRFAGAGELLSGALLSGAFLLSLVYLSGSTFNPFIYYRF